MKTGPAVQLASQSFQVSTCEMAYKACLNLCRSHYENFPVASHLVPSFRRGAIAAVYAFARVADDFADEPGWDEAERLRLLSDWRERLNRCRADHNRHPVFWAVSHAMEQFQLPPDPFHRLLDAFEMDVRQKRYRTFDDVLGYCSLSANPVGELVLRIFEQWTVERGQWSDAICTALQLANFWQDIKIDGFKGRLYIPLEDVAVSGLSERYVMEGGGEAALRRELMSRQVERTWALFRKGRPLCDSVSGPLRFELRLVWLGGTGILRKIEAGRFDPWQKRPAHGSGDWIGYLGKSIMWRRENRS